MLDNLASRWRLKLPFEPLDVARADAFALVDRDPSLHEPEHRTLAEHLRSHFREELSLVKVG